MESTTNSVRAPEISRVLRIIISIAAIAIFVIVGLYVSQFQGGMSAKPEVWGQFGDYIGGTLNPLLSFLALLSLCLTLLVQSRQLHISEEQLVFSRQELYATRIELQQSSKSQALTARALERQAEFMAISARLSALSASQVVVGELIANFQRAGILEGPPHQYAQLLTRKEELGVEIIRISESLLER